jgi:hypothetical protein
MKRALASVGPLLLVAGMSLMLPGVFLSITHTYVEDLVVSLSYTAGALTEVGNR